MKPRVFIPQHPTKFDPDTKLLVNDGDLSGIHEFGDPIFVIRSGRLLDRQLPRTIRWIEDALFDFGPQDYLAMIGDSQLYAVSLFIASRNIKAPVRIIRWNRRTNAYKVSEANLGGLLWHAQKPLSKS